MHPRIPANYIPHQNRCPNFLCKIFLTYGNITFDMNNFLSHPFSDKKNVVTLHKIFCAIGWFRDPYIYILFLVFFLGHHTESKFHHPFHVYLHRVVPVPDGTIYLVRINETHYWGSLVRYMYWGQKYFSEKIETYQYMQKKKVHVLMVFFPPPFPVYR